MEELIALMRSTLGNRGSGRADLIRAGRELGWVPRQFSRNVKDLPSSRKDQLIRSFIDRLPSNPAAVQRFKDELNFTPSGTGGGGPLSTISNLVDVGRGIARAVGGDFTGLPDIFSGVSGLTGAAGGRQGGGGLVPGNGFQIPDVPQFNGNGGAQTISTQTPSTMNGQISQLLGSNQIVMEPRQKTINSAPPGWVICTMPDGSKKAVLKEVAKCLGLWKPRRKPPITASDWRKLKRANAVKKKAKRIGKTAGFKVTNK